MTKIMTKPDGTYQPAQQCRSGLGFVGISSEIQYTIDMRIKNGDGGKIRINTIIMITVFDNHITFILQIRS